MDSKSITFYNVIGIISLACCLLVFIGFIYFLYNVATSTVTPVTIKVYDINGNQIKQYIGELRVCEGHVPDNLQIKWEIKDGIVK